MDHNKLEILDAWPFMLPALRRSSINDCVLINVNYNKIKEFMNTVNFTLAVVSTTNRECILLYANYNQFNDFGILVLVTSIIETLRAKRIAQLLRLYNYYIYLDGNPFHCECTTANVICRFNSMAKVMQREILPVWSLKVKCNTPKIVAWATSFPCKRNKNELSCVCGLFIRMPQLFYL